MSDGRRLFQLYLLGQMRSRENVVRALATLGASWSELESARGWAVEMGLEGVGTRLSAFEDILGPPVARGTRRTGDPYERVWLTYRLRVWPLVGLNILGSEDGVSAGLRFDRVESLPEKAVSDLKDLVPWSTIREDLPSRWSLTPTDDWYPVWDVQVEPTPAQGRALLQFDFGLLQVVNVLGTNLAGSDLSRDSHDGAG